MNKAAMNIIENMSLWDGGASFRYMVRSDIAGSWRMMYLLTETLDWKYL